MKSKKGTSYVATILFLLLIGIITFCSIHYFTYDKTCLEEKATNYCSQNNMEFGYVSKDEFFKPMFACQHEEDRTAKKYLIYHFLDSEMKECKK